jgi:hypothetical protein
MHPNCQPTPVQLIEPYFSIFSIHQFSAGTKTKSPETKVLTGLKNGGI